MHNFKAGIVSMVTATTPVGGSSTLKLVGNVVLEKESKTNKAEIRQLTVFCINCKWVDRVTEWKAARKKRNKTNSKHSPDAGVLKCYKLMSLFCCTKTSSATCVSIWYQYIAAWWCHINGNFNYDAAFRHCWTHQNYKLSGHKQHKPGSRQEKSRFSMMTNVRCGPKVWKEMVRVTKFVLHFHFLVVKGAERDH